MYRVKWFNKDFQVTRMLDYRGLDDAVHHFNNLRQSENNKWAEIYWVPLQPEMFPI